MALREVFEKFTVAGGTSFCIVKVKVDTGVGAGVLDFEQLTKKNKMIDKGVKNESMFSLKI